MASLRAQFARTAARGDRAATLRGDKPKLSVVVPALNEARRLGKSAERLAAAINSGSVDPVSTEFIVVDDGSTDETAAISQAVFGPIFPRLRVLRLDTNSGKGAAIRAGADAASAPIVVFMDADMAVDPVQLPSLVSALDDADIAIGSRRMELSVVISDSYRRSIMARTFSYLVNSLTNVAIKDTQCGFKAFRSPMARVLFHNMTIRGFAFDAEVLYLARRLGLRIAEVPVHWRDELGTTVRPIADPAFMAYDVVRMRAGKKGTHIPAATIATRADAHRSSTAGVPTSVLDVVGVNIPIVPLPNDRAFVLFPLSCADEYDQTIERLHQLSPNVSVSERPIGFAELLAMAPLLFLSGRWDDSKVHSSSTDRLQNPAHASSAPEGQNSSPNSSFAPGA